MKIFILITALILSGCGKNKDLEVFYNVGHSIADFEERHKNGYFSSEERLNHIKSVLLIEPDVFESVMAESSMPDISGYFYSYKGRKKFVTLFYVLVLSYSPDNKNRYDSITFYFDEQGRLIWINCSLSALACKDIPLPDERGWFFKI